MSKNPEIPKKPADNPFSLYSVLAEVIELTYLSGEELKARDVRTQPPPPPKLDRSN